MQTPQKQSKELARLFSAFPPLSNPDPDETLRRYFEAIEDFPAGDLETAVTLYITGKVPGFDGRFAPTPPMLATGCRIAAEMRQREAYLKTFSAPRLPAPVLQKTPQERQSVREKMAAAIDNLAASMALQEVEAMEASKARWERTNERFHPDMSDDAIMERLIRKRGYWTGNDYGDVA